MNILENYIIIYIRYPSYLFSMILKMPHYDNLYKTQINQQESENNNNISNNNQFAFNFERKLKNEDPYIYIS